MKSNCHQASFQLSSDIEYLPSYRFYPFERIVRVTTKARLHKDGSDLIYVCPEDTSGYATTLQLSNSQVNIRPKISDPAV